MPEEPSTPGSLSARELDELNRLLIAKERIVYSKDFGEFFKAAWKIIEPATPFVDSWHYEYICEWLTYAASGQFRKDHPEKVGLWICVPPRTSKSNMISIAFPVWTWASWPHERFICVSYGDDLATPLSAKRRDVLKSEWFAKRWPNVRIKDDQDLKTRFDSTANGYMVAGTPGGTITGLGGSRIILDDLLKAKDAYSETVRNGVNEFYDNTLRSRLNNPVSDFFIGISQRLHDNDIVGFLRKQEPERWTFIDIPLEAEQEQEYRFPLSAGCMSGRKATFFYPSALLLR